VAADKKREPIWPFVIPATLIATAWAAAIVLASGDVREEQAGNGAYLIGYFSASAIVPSLFVWVPFYLLFFRPRASIGKALRALFVMCAFTFGLQFAPLAVVSVLRGDEPAAQLYLQQSIARVTALNDGVMADLQALNLPADDAAGVESKTHVAAWLGRLRQAAARIEAYDAALAREAQAAHAEFAGMNLREARRAQYAAEIDSALGPDAPLRRANAERLAELRKAAETLALLAENPDAWVVQNNQPAFYDAALLTRYRALTDELAAIRRRRLAAEAALSAWADAPSAQQNDGGQPQER
jgi:hypothetical protein